MSTDQADQLKLGAAMIQRASHITGYAPTAFRIGPSANHTIRQFHTAALHEAMIRRGISYQNRLELLRVSFFPEKSPDPFFEQLVQFYTETPTP